MIDFCEILLDEPIEICEELSLARWKDDDIAVASVASANSFGRGFSTSPIGFGVVILGGASNFTSGRLVSAGGRRTNSGFGRGARGRGTEISAGGTVGRTRWS